MDMWVASVFEGRLWLISMILESWDQVLHQVPHGEPASPSAYVSAFLSVSLMNK